MGNKTTYSASELTPNTKYLFAVLVRDATGNISLYEPKDITTKYMPVSSVTLNKTDVLLAVGGSIQLEATVLPANAAYKDVTWTSSDESKATVSSTGLVTWKALGIVIITVTTAEGGKTAKCTVYMNPSDYTSPNIGKLKGVLGGTFQRDSISS